MDLLEKKSRERYEKWRQEVKERDKEKRDQNKIEEQTRQKEILNKKLASEEAYREWLKKSKKKKRPSRNTYGYSEGSLFSYYDMGSTPPPSYMNPMPWVANVTNSAKDKKNLRQREFSSPPMLWKEIEERKGKQNRNYSKQKHVVSKHSCINVAP